MTSRLLACLAVLPPLLVMPRPRAGAGARLQQQAVPHRADRRRRTGASPAQVELENDDEIKGQKFYADVVDLLHRRRPRSRPRGNVLYETRARRASPPSGWCSTPAPAPAPSTPPRASRRSAIAADKSMFGTLEPDVVLLRRAASRRSAEDKLQAHQGRLHHLRAADAALGDGRRARSTINVGDYAMLRERRDAGEGRAGLLPAGRSTTRSRTTTGPPASCCPTYGRSTFQGQSISNAFFWAINRSQDLTVMHDWFTETGQGYGSEYRWVRRGQRRRQPARPTG